MPATIAHGLQVLADLQRSGQATPVLLLARIRALPRRGRTGLGLGIARRIVTAHGRTTDLDNKPGEGTVCTARFRTSLGMKRRYRHERDRMDDTQGLDYRSPLLHPG